MFVSRVTLLFCDMRKNSRGFDNVLLQESVFLLVSGDFDPGGAPVRRLRHGHLNVTRGTALFPPQPLLDTLRTGTVR